MIGWAHIGGGHDAQSVENSIFTEGNELTDMKAMVNNAALCHFDDDPRPIARFPKGKGEAKAWGACWHA